MKIEPYTPANKECYVTTVTGNLYRMKKECALNRNKRMKHIKRSRKQFNKCIENMCGKPTNN